MNNAEAALNSLLVASMVNNEDAQVVEFIGNIYEEKDQLLMACEFWQKAANMGSSKARIKSKKVCGSTIPDKEDIKKKKKKSKIEDAKFPSEQRKEDAKDKENADDMKDESSSDEGEHNDDSLGKPSKDTVLKKKREESKEDEEDESKD